MFLPHRVAKHQTYQDDAWVVSTQCYSEWIEIIHLTEYRPMLKEQQLNIEKILNKI